MYHPLNINSVKIDYTNNNQDSIAITSKVKVSAKTGVEMEALTVKKSGGMSGTFNK
jgi:cyclic pyranopterin phosphate synthase